MYNELFQHFKTVFSLHLYYGENIYIIASNLKFNLYNKLNSIDLLTKAKNY